MNYANAPPSVLYAREYRVGTTTAHAVHGHGPSVVALRSSRGGTRTPDPVINSHLLYQLSYSGKLNGVEINRRTA